MPLIKSMTQAAIRMNTATEIKAGKPPAQAYAIANSVARQLRKKRRAGTS